MDICMQAFRKPEGNESLLSYQAGALQGVVGGRSNSAAPPGSTQMAQQSRKFFDLSQLHGSSQEGQKRNQGVEQQAQNPVHQAYLQYAFQAAQQKQALAMQSQQQQAKMGVLGPTSGKDQEMHSGNLKMQELTSMQAASQAQASAFKNSSVVFSHGEKPVEQGKQLPSEQKPQMQPPGFGQLMPTNVLRLMQDPDAEKSIHNITSNPVAMQAMQACALMHNIDLSNPANFNSMAQIISQMQRTWMTQQKLNDNNAAPESSSVAVAKQQVTSPPGANESSPHINSPIDLSGQTGSAKVKHAVPPSPFGTTASAGIINNNNNTAGQQLAFHGRENQVPSRQAVGFGNGMPSMHPPLSASNMEHGPDQTLSPKNVSSVTENMQSQHLRQLTSSSSQSAGPSNDGNTGNRLSTQGGSIVESAQQHVGFTKQQLHVLKAQILAFRRLKVSNALLLQ